MKVLHITNAYPLDVFPAFGIFIKEQIDSLTNIGIENDVFFINAKENGKKEYYKAIKQLKKKTSNGYDIIHCHHTFSAFVALRSLSKKPILVSFLGSGNTDAVKLPSFISSRLHNYVLKNTQGRIFKNGVPPELSSDTTNYYVPNGVNTDFFAPQNKQEAKKQLGLDTNKRYILFVSAMDLHRPEKRYDIYEKTIQILQNKYGMTDVAELHLVNAERKDVPLYFNASSLHLLVSDFEGSPNSVKESLSCNTPIVATDVGNVKQMIGNVKDCACSASNDPEHLAELVSNILKEEKEYDLRQVLIQQSLDQQSIAHKLQGIYTELIQNYTS